MCQKTCVVGLTPTEPSVGHVSDSVNPGLYLRSAWLTRPASQGKDAECFVWAGNVTKEGEQFVGCPWGSKRNLRIWGLWV